MSMIQTFTFRIKPGIYFADDPAFKAPTRAGASSAPHEFPSI
jgi:hypothetical protein